MSTRIGMAIGVFFGNLLVCGILDHDWRKGCLVGLVAAILFLAFYGLFPNFGNLSD